MTRSLLLALLFSVLTFIMALPFSLHPGSRLLVDAPDTHLFLWTLAWEAHALVTQPLSIFDGNFYYPYDNTLAWSETILGSGLIAAPIIWLTGNVVLALNLVALLSHVLCGLGAWLLARTVGVGPYGATVSGIIFAFSPARFFRMSQHHLTTVQWMPFSLAFVYAYLEHGRPRDLRLAILFFTLQALTSGHGAVFLTLAILVLLVYRAALGEPLAPLRRLRDMGVTGALLFVPVGWIWWHYRRAQTEMGLVRELFPNDWFPALQSFAASPTHVDIFLQRLVTGRVLNDQADSFLFPGLLPIVLALAAFIPVLGAPPVRGTWRARWRTSAVGFCVVLTLASLWIFLRPPFGAWPYLYWLPVLNLIRMPSRFMILTLLPLSVLAGIGFERAFARLRSTQWLAADDHRHHTAARRVLRPPVYRLPVRHGHPGHRSLAGHAAEALRGGRSAGPEVQRVRPLRALPGQLPPAFHGPLAEDGDGVHEHPAARSTDACTTSCPGSPTTPALPPSATSVSRSSSCTRTSTNAGGWPRSNGGWRRTTTICG